MLAKAQLMGDEEKVNWKRVPFTINFHSWRQFTIARVSDRKWPIFHVLVVFCFKLLFTNKKRRSLDSTNSRTIGLDRMRVRACWDLFGVEGRDGGGRGLFARGRRGRTCGWSVQEPGVEAHGGSMPSPPQAPVREKKKTYLEGSINPSKYVFNGGDGPLCGTCKLHFSPFSDFCNWKTSHLLVETRVQGSW